MTFENSLLEQFEFKLAKMKQGSIQFPICIWKFCLSLNHHILSNVSKILGKVSNFKVNFYLCDDGYNCEGLLEIQRC